MNSVMEFILRMKDEASAGITRVKAALSGTKDTANQVKPGLEGVSGVMKGFTDSFEKAKGAIMGVIGVLGIVGTVAKVSWEFGKKALDFREFWDPVAASLKTASAEMERYIQKIKVLAAFESDEKTRISEISEAYDKEATAAANATAKIEALAAAKEKAGASKLNQTMTQIGAQEKAALDQGYDPASVKIAADDARRRAQADAGISSAQGGSDSAQRELAAAQEAYDAANKHTLNLQDQIMQAEGQKAAARKALTDLESGYLVGEERAAKERAILMSDRKADITIALAQKELDKASIGETSAKDAVDVAKANAEAAGEAMKDALTTRDAAEFEYQSDVADFWNKRDEDDRAAQQAALEALRTQMAERKKLADEQTAAEHADRVEDIKAEAALSEQSAAAAQDRLSRAHSAAQTAWGWYRDPESFKRQRAEEQANAAAEKQFAKDAENLTGRTGWRDSRLDDRQESVRRVVLAREEERAAARSLANIDKNTADLNAMLKTLLTSR